MKKENKETTYTTCHCEKSSLPSIRVRIKGEVKALLKPLKIKGFKRRKDSPSPLGRLCCLRNTRCRTPLLNEERGKKAGFTLSCKSFRSRLLRALHTQSHRKAFANQVSQVSLAHTPLSLRI
ncbi:hypothetical protein IJS77_01625, partial [bacterium]|nr:hypothetical protein [bacterium]